MSLRDEMRWACFLVAAVKPAAAAAVDMWVSSDDNEVFLQVSTLWYMLYLLIEMLKQASVPYKYIAVSGKSRAEFPFLDNFFGFVSFAFVS